MVFRRAIEVFGDVSGIGVWLIDWGLPGYDT